MNQSTKILLLKDLKKESSSRNYNSKYNCVQEKLVSPIITATTNTDMFKRN